MALSWKLDCQVSHAISTRLHCTLDIRQCEVRPLGYGLTVDGGKYRLWWFSSVLWVHLEVLIKVIFPKDGGLDIHALQPWTNWFKRVETPTINDQIDLTAGKIGWERERERERMTERETEGEGDNGKCIGEQRRREIWNTKLRSWDLSTSYL